MMTGASSPPEDARRASRSVAIDGAEPSFRAVKAASVVLLLGAVLDTAVGLGVIGTSPIPGALLLGIGVSECYLAYGLWHRQRWGLRGTLLTQGVAIVPLVVLGTMLATAPKLALLGYLLWLRNADWR
ncbi:hypothetical protein L593_08955 [Salinarchaeum sp. Harcht-Bsk1]|uniref:hypothetical protein n=1 Tax=Salinarchaeum sp. Harcht-Bsk1 TaxID=1333523 RepID=UPI000342486C|nr:hypothetical protein [Salinarchaeum sp. Harcht-Bsk1]AGN01736.1 hypothetical protein L593_08955 [Salinarchaeum sp. Harcht-Bsk1]